jgi:hypothetical protein
MTKKLHMWDELLLEIQRFDTPHELAKLAAASLEGGWEHSETLPNGVEVWRTDRHFSLQAMAEDADEAHRLFSEYPEYREYHEEIQ